MKIMFVCTGNICRSAIAHKMLEKKIKEKNLNIEVYSCGIFATTGDMSPKYAIDVMEEYKIDLNNHRATNIEDSNIKKMDLILCATTLHKNRVIQMYPELKDKTYTIKEYIGYPIYDLELKDPWGLEKEQYKLCAKQINIYLDLLLEKI